MSMARWWAVPASRPRSFSPSRRFIDRIASLHPTTTNSEEVMRLIAAIAIAAAICLLGFGPADAAEIKVMISNALKSTMEELTPEFEKASGNELAITFGAAAELKASIEKGTPIDLAILTTATTDDLVKEGKLIAAGR